jgi:hypothetical protein
VVETFTQSVQPVLMNHCASGGCHGPQSDTALRLFRVPAGKSASRRITQRNLYAVLPLVDRENPMNSRLLTAPNGPHGAAKHGVFTEHQTAQYKRLIDWANQLTQQSTPETIATLTPAAPVKRTPTPPKVLSQDAQKAHPLPAAAQASTVKRGAVTASFDQSADPLDPEVFNRRFAPKETPAKNHKKTTEEGN